MRNQIWKTLVSTSYLSLPKDAHMHARTHTHTHTHTHMPTHTGIGAAAGSASSLMAECSPTVHRGKLTMMVTGLGTAGGMATVAGAGILFHDLSASIGPDWWRLVLLACIMPTFLGLIFIWYVPESPHWCLVNGREEEAESLIRQLAKENRSEDRLLAGGAVFYRAMDDDGKERGLSELFQPNLRGSTLFICSVFVTSCFAFCGHTYIYPLILRRTFEEQVDSEYYDMMWAALAQVCV